MKISIITVVLNGEQTITDTIESVLTQTYQNIEYIIIDGESNDQTLEIIKSYGNQINHWISEPDQGLYDAMNKGIHLATGDIVGILNSDDIYAHQHIIEIVAKAFKQQQTDSLYGDIKLTSKDLKKTIRFWRAGNFNKDSLKKGWHPPHPSFFVKRHVYQTYGQFNTDFKIAADYELMLRFLYRYEISSSYIPEIFVKQRVGGKSNKNIINICKANLECCKAFMINDLPFNPLLFFLKPLSKISQFFNPEKVKEH